MQVKTMRISAPNLLRRLLVLMILVTSLSACGPSLRYRPADVLPKGAVELGAGLGLAVDAEENAFGGAEVQTWLRGGVADRVEMGLRFWTYTLVSAAGSVDLRIQLVRGPIDISLDGSVLAGVCCELGEDNQLLAGALGFDTGLSIGKRFGGARGPAVYFAPHLQMSWTLPQEKYWPMLLSLPIGVDIPLGAAPFALRPEFIVSGELYRNGDQSWRVGGGIALALQLPSPKEIKARRAARRKAKEEAELKLLEESLKGYGLGDAKSSGESEGDSKFGGKAL